MLLHRRTTPAPTILLPLALARIYYDRETRAWWAYALTPAGDQIGDAVTGASKPRVADALRDVMLGRAGMDEPATAGHRTEAELWCLRAMAHGVRMV